MGVSGCIIVLRVLIGSSKSLATLDLLYEGLAGILDYLLST